MFRKCVRSLDYIFYWIKFKTYLYLVFIINTLLDFTWCLIQDNTSLTKLNTSFTKMHRNSYSYTVAVTMNFA